MRIVATLKSIDEIDKLAQMNVGAFLLQTNFLTAKSIFPFTKKELRDAVNEIHKRQKRAYVSLNTMIHEDMIQDLDEAILYFKDIQVDGIVCYDFTVALVAQKHNFQSKVIYQPGTYNTNEYDPTFLAQFGLLGYTISREVTLEDIIKIAENETDLEVSYVGHGYLDMFYSKRPLLRNYQTYIEKPALPLFENKSLYLIEKQREKEHFPIYEDRFGTYIMRPKKLASFQELGVLKPYLADFFIERYGISDEEYYDAISSYDTFDSGTTFMEKYHDTYDSGFYYLQTERRKGELNEA